MMFLVIQKSDCTAKLLDHNILATSLFRDPVPPKFLELPQRDVEAAAPFNLHRTAAYRKDAANLLAKG